MRRNLALSRQQLRYIDRAQSTASAAAASRATANKSFLSRNRGRIAWIWLAGLLGWMGGSFTSHTISPPPLPAPGTREDGILMADLNQRIDNEFKVKVLRGKCLGVARLLKGEEGGWVEIVPQPSSSVVNGKGEVEAPSTGKRLADALAGAKGLGVQRVFWDRGEHQLVSVVWFGGSIAGWPGVTHGGAIATELTEKTALAASLASDGALLDVSEAALPQRMPGTGDHAKMFAPAATPSEPSQLSLSYVKPTLSNDFYIIRVSPALILDQDPEHIVPSETVGGHEWEATLEKINGKDVGQICVKAKARFEPGSPAERAVDKIKGTAEGGYGQFKEWMWPSRQKSSS
ncbi:hypothetical protein K431DRAFT_319824 [Polychaeton citri CBS 116435]|uniref:Uncharacterized protein n=1 Tax=Polychaeton citri CBS 116435 TaxID=1314669 RepID=A0A9P4QC62_9PEZI|nr:hypothetical protein K431DRAFT_319824 [Polychaeton citri CBS 116435]